MHLYKKIKNNIEYYYQCNLKFISKLKPSNYKELLKISLDQYKQYVTDKGDVFNDTKIYVTNKKIYGTEKKIVIKYNQAHFDAEHKTLNEHLLETEKGLKELESRLN